MGGQLHSNGCEKQCFRITKSKFAFATTKPTGRASSTMRTISSTSSRLGSSNCLALGYDYAHLERDGILLVVNKIAC